MNALAILPGAVASMTSLEIAELVESRHDSVKRTIERLANQGVISLPPLVEVKVQRERRMEVVSAYEFSGDQGRRDSTVVVAQLSPQFTARLVDRWQELERRAAAPAVVLPDFTDPAVAAIAWAEQYRAKSAAEAERNRLAIENQAKGEALAIAVPKAEALDRISASEGTRTITQAAKELGIKRNALVARMNAERWIYRQNGSWVAYEAFIRNGCLQYKEATYTDENTDQEVRRAYCHITTKGLARLAQLLSVALIATA